MSDTVSNDGDQSDYQYSSDEEKKEDEVLINSPLKDGDIQEDDNEDEDDPEKMSTMYIFKCTYNMCI
jgi:hypothetical protein